MRKETFLLVLGAGVFVTPFLGLPQAWITIYLYALGGLIVLVAISCRIQSRRKNRASDSGALHVERDPGQEKNADNK